MKKLFSILLSVFITVSFTAGFDFTAQAATTTVNINFCDNLCNNYLTNFTSSNAESDYTVDSDNTSYISVTTSKISKIMTIKASKAGDKNHCMRWKTTCNRSYNYDFGKLDTSTKILAFMAKSSVNGVKMYFRWGYDSNSCACVTLSTERTAYAVSMPRTANSGGHIHPWVDKACSIEIDNLHLGDELNNIDIITPDDSQTVKTYSVNSKLGTLPTPKSTKGYCFDGWYTKRVGGTQISSSDIASTNAYYYAHWTDHTYGASTTISPTCTTDGYSIHYCTSCSAEQKYDYTDALGHNYVNGVCTRCNEIDSSYKQTETDNTNSSATDNSSDITSETDDSAYDYEYSYSYRIYYVDDDNNDDDDYSYSYSSIDDDYDYDNTSDSSSTATSLKTKITKLKKGKKSATVKWKKVSDVDGYQVQVATDKKFKKNRKSVFVNNGKKTKTTVKRLKSKKKYYVRVRSFYWEYELNGRRKYYSKWSKVKTVKTK